MRAKCPKCQQIVDYNPENAAQPIRCPHCQQAFRVGSKNSSAGTGLVASVAAPPTKAATSSPPTAGGSREAAAQPVAPALPAASSPSSTDPNPFNLQLDAGKGSRAGDANFAGISQTRLATRPKRRSTNALFLSLLIGVPIVLLLACGGFGYWGIQEAARQEKRREKLTSDAREFALSKALPHIISDNRLWPALFLVSGGENNRFRVEQSVNEISDTAPTIAHKYEAEVSYNEATGQWKCHKLSVNGVAKQP